MRPPCQAACPINTNVQGYLFQIAQGNYRKSLEIIKEPNPLPSVCGRICTRPCETYCRRGKVDEPLAIRALKRFAVEYPFNQGSKERKAEQEPKYSEKVAIVGSGPAGLSAAHDLAKLGYKSTIFEALPVVGGMLRVGIPQYRLPAAILEKDIQAIISLGVEVRKNSSIGQEISLEDLFNQGYNAIFLAIGAHKSLKLDIPGEDLEGVITGTEFLRGVRLGEKIKVGKRVAVIGGGDTALDAAMTVLRTGATEVRILYRRSPREMPAREEEIREAQEEGVKISYLVAPKKILGKEGKVTGIECIKMKLGKADESGRRRPLPIKGSEFTFDVDTVIPAIGQFPEAIFPSGNSNSEGLKLTERGTIAVNHNNLATNLAGVFAGGDGALEATEPAAAIEAIASGKKAALAIHYYLREGELPSLEEEEIPEVGSLSQDAIEKIVKLKREPMPTLGLEERFKDFDQVEIGFDEISAVREAQRCLNCGVGAEVIEEKCAGCLTCVRICPFDVPVMEGEIARIDEALCQACGICPVECPAKAISFKLYEEKTLLEKVDNLLAKSSLEAKQAKVVGFYCVYGAFEGLDTVVVQSPKSKVQGQESEGIANPYSSEINAIRVLCTGKIGADDLLKVFELGAEAVWLAGCLDKRCRFYDGNLWAKKRVRYAQKILEELGWDKERLQIIQLPSPFDIEKLIEIDREMEKRIKGTMRS